MPAIKPIEKGKREAFGSINVVSKELRSYDVKFTLPQP
jgi:hypothetical protein